MSALRWSGLLLAALGLVAGMALLGRSMPHVSHVPPTLPVAEPILLPENVGAPVGPTHVNEPEKHSIRSPQGVHAGIMAF